MIENFKVGDEIYEEFKLKEIREVRDGIIWSLHDKYFISSGNYSPSQCFPVEDKVKSLSETFENWSHELHQLNAQLNYPKIRGYLNNRWIDACDARTDDEKCFNIMQSVSAFIETIKYHVESQKQIVVHGVNIFGR